MTIPKALYRGKLPIGGMKLDCFVLDDSDTNPTRILSQETVFTAFDIPRNSISDSLEIAGNKVSSFIVPKNLESLITPEIINCIKPIGFTDGGHLRWGYNTNLLPILCDLYLEAQRKGILLESQMRIADQAGRLLYAFAKVGLTALIDEATGYQLNRKYDALRILLEAYLTDKPTGWTKQFPDDFFYELDRLYDNERIKASQRPRYYGTFINKYVYEVIEKGKMNPELQRHFKAGKKDHNKYQWLTEDIGKQQLQLQIGKILGLMQVAPSFHWFKEKQER
jgi:hypothetical protein